MDAFITAMDFEKKGYDIYAEAAIKTSNPFIAEVFSYLAEQELMHIECIKEYMEEGRVELKGDKLEDTKRFFSTTVIKFKKRLKPSDSDLNGYEAAMGLEMESYKFYKKRYSMTTNNQLKDFFNFLMVQERVHLDLIRNTYKQLNNLSMSSKSSAGEQKWMAYGGHGG